MRRVSISANAPTAGAAESMVRTEMQKRHKAGRITGSAVASNQRPNSEVAVYATKGDNNRTYMVYVEIP